MVCLARAGVALLLLIYAQLVPAFSFLGVQQAEVAGTAERSWTISLTEASDQSFWTRQWYALEDELLQLQGVVSVITTPVNATAHVPAGQPTTSKSTVTIAKSNASKVVGDLPKRVNSNASAARHVASKVATSDESSKVLAKVQGMVKGLEGKAMLAPMLEMLKGMYEEQKKRIGDLNKREQQSKKRFETQKQEFYARMNATKQKHDDHRLNDEFFANETRDYTRQFKYWEGVRARNKRQYHNALKITHGMMQREKDMVAQYERAMKTPVPQKQAAAQAKVPEESPEVVFLQQHVATDKFCQKVLVEVQSELARWKAPVRNVVGRRMW